MMNLMNMRDEGDIGKNLNLIQTEINMDLLDQIIFIIFKQEIQTIFTYICIFYLDLKFK